MVNYGFHQRGFGPKRACALLCSCTTLALVIFGIVVVSTGFSTLDQTEYGLDHDTIYRKVEKTVYTAGLHYLGFGHTFIKVGRTRGTHTQQAIFTPHTHQCPVSCGWK
jgi:hypothetical protein